MNRSINCSINRAACYRRRRSCGWFGLICVAGFMTALGCSPEPKVSDAGEAKRVLQTSLEAWKAGKTPEDMKALTPPIYVGDQLWLGGGKLKEYAIKSEGEFLETSVSFPVTLHITGEPRARQAVYWVSTNPALSVTLGE